MPVEFLTAGQRADFGRYTTEPTAVELARCFHLDDAEHQHLAGKRGTASRLGFALQLTTVRFLGRFLEEEREIPRGVIRFMAREIGLNPPAAGLGSYWGQRQRLRHVDGSWACGSVILEATTLLRFAQNKGRYVACRQDF